MSTTYRRNEAQGNTIVDTALELADEGIPVFPVSSRKTPVWKKGSNGPDKNGFHLASTDPEEVERIFTDPQVANRVAGIAVPTGKAINATVIDVDCGKGKKSRDEALAWLEQNRTTTLWGAKVVRTTSGGLHYYCKYTPGIPTAGNVWAKGVDCRNDGGYVLVPPFLGYRIERDTDPEDWPSPPPAPPALTTKVEDYQAHGGETPPEVKQLIRIMTEAKGDDDGWHTAALRLVAHMVGAGWSDAEILKMAVPWTKGGYTHAQTFDDLCVMIAGARAKWKKAKEPKSTDGLRVQKFISIWEACSSDGRRQILDMVKEVQGD